ncbi:MAG: alpha/beta fold hydrolase [Thermoleophilia bacterium]|nr:alpha/beta fold hydrolase [Thermoleophilia bacterium]
MTRSSVAALLVTAALVVHGCGGAGDPGGDAATGPTPPSAERPGAVDGVVAVDGGDLHVRCVGSGDATVVLIAGFGDGGENWGTVEPPLARSARVCSYARFGTGASDPAPAPQTHESHARTLRTLLRSIGEAGPFALVGHSLGGAEAVVFASLFRSEVSGLMLIDASPANWIAAGCSVPDDGTEAARGFAGMCRSLTDPALNPERLDGRAASEGVAAVTSLGRLPMTVLTTTERPFPGIDPRQQARLDRVWNRGQEHWASLSPISRLVRVPGAGHYIHVDRPAVVVAELRRLTG